MKVTLKHRLRSYQGECDDLVYYYNRRTGTTLARRYVKPRYSSANHKLGQGARHLRALNPSPLYLQDLKLYIELHNSLRDPEDGLLNNRWALYTKVMYAQAKALGLSVTQLTPELIQAQQSPCRCVKTAVEAGFLEVVEGYERLTNPMLAD